jgi:hypothetical protein
MTHEDPIIMVDNGKLFISLGLHSLKFSTVDE